MTFVQATPAQIESAENALREDDVDEANWPTGDQVEAVIEAALTDATEPLGTTIKRAERHLMQVGRDRGTWPTSDQVASIISAVRSSR